MTASIETQDIIGITCNVEGWLTDKEGQLLYDLASKCRGKGVIVEIGSWKGKSTIWLGRGSKRGLGTKVYAVDPHIGFPDVEESYGKIWTFDEFKLNVTTAAVGDVIVPIVKTSEEAARRFDQPVELIFIDGVHQYDYVKQDFNLWFPKVVQGGIMAFHDTTGGLGAKKVVEELVYKSRSFRNIGLADSITFAEKVERNSMWDRIRNRYVLTLKHIYEFGSKVHAPRLVRKAGKRLLGFK